MNWTLKDEIEFPSGGKRQEFSVRTAGAVDRMSTSGVQGSLNGRLQNSGPQLNLVLKTCFGLTLLRNFNQYFKIVKFHIKSEFCVSLKNQL